MGPFRLTAPLVSRPSSFAPVYYAPELLDGWFTQSAAHLEHGFVYLPSGYFFSAYEASVAEQSARWALQYLEGSLFDYQVGDLFSQCNAGDIRIRFHSVTPGVDGVSVIARLADSAGTLDPIPTQTNYPVSLVYEGEWSTVLWLVRLRRRE
jgi:Transmembrane protein 43